MLQSTIPTTSTERVVARLTSEGWIDCPGLGFPALCQHALPDLRSFVLDQLQQNDNWGWEVDLQLTTLVFSIPEHEFQFHPYLDRVLKQLKEERVIEIQEFEKRNGSRVRMERAILLKTVNVA
jgi:hypothetical protein